MSVCSACGRGLPSTDDVATCPACGAPAASVAIDEGDGRHKPKRAPWHFWAVVAAAAGYLAWRVVEGAVALIAWLFG